MAAPIPVVLVAEELSLAAIAQLESGFEVRSVDGSDRAALLPALAGVDAVIVRSATRIDAEALAQATNLRAALGLLILTSLGIAGLATKWPGQGGEAQATSRRSRTGTM